VTIRTFGGECATLEHTDEKPGSTQRANTSFDGTGHALSGGMIRATGRTVGGNVRTGALPRGDEHQGDLYERNSRLRGQRPPSARAQRRIKPLCAGCRAKEARYGFHDEALLEPSRTLCFDCFRLEIGRRQERVEQLTRARNAAQLELPISETLDQIDRRRRRAQIAARHALRI
jgi:hypothetical protein